MTLVRTILLLALTSAACNQRSDGPAAEGNAGPKLKVLAKTAAQTAPVAPAPKKNNEQRVTFDKEPSGERSKEFEGIVGEWYVADAGGGHGLRVDGSKWRKGQPSASLDSQSVLLFGEQATDFARAVKTSAFFPLAVWRKDAPPGDVRLSTKFFPITGRSEQAAGIAFAITAGGTYFGVRASAHQNDLVLFRVNKGKQMILHTVPDIATPSKAWHTLSIELRGNRITAELDRKPRFEKTLDAPLTGRVGLWSSDDSEVLFDSFVVTALPPS
jgi:hypothetical protein